MKRLALLLTILTLLFVQTTIPVSAITTTPAKASTPATKTTEDSSLNNKINDLKEKIASRVSELNLVEKRGVIGTIVEVSGDNLTIKDVNGDSRIIDVDEITKFSSGTLSKSSFGLSDMKKTMRISVLGLYNKQSKRLLARFIKTSIDPVFLSGTITDIDKKNYHITITTPDKKQHLVDILTTTKTQIYNKESGLKKSGFSELIVGGRVTVLGYPNKKDPTLLSAERILDLSALPGNPNVAVSATTATSSGEKQ